MSFVIEWRRSGRVREAVHELENGLRAMKKSLCIFALVLAACGNNAANAALDFKEIGPDTYSVAFPREMPLTDVETAAKTKCGRAMICKVLGWNDTSKIASRLPMTNPEVISQVFDFSLNRNTGYEEAKWECSAYPTAPRDSCFSAPTIKELEEANDL